MQTQRSFLDTPPTFGGATYCPERDEARLSTALGKVYSLMSDGAWRSLAEIALAVGCSEAGASSRLRDLRKEGFKDKYPNGGVEAKRISGGHWQYRLLT